MIILFFLATILICLIEGVPLIKKGLWRELCTFSFLIGIAFFLVIAKKMDIPPVGWLQHLLGPVGEAIFKSR